MRPMRALVLVPEVGGIEWQVRFTSALRAQGLPFTSDTLEHPLFWCLLNALGPDALLIHPGSWADVEDLMPEEYEAGDGRVAREASERELPIRCRCLSGATGGGRPFHGRQSRSRSRGPASAPRRLLASRRTPRASDNWGKPSRAAPFCPRAFSRRSLASAYRPATHLSGFAQRTTRSHGRRGPARLPPVQALDERGVAYSSTEIGHDWELASFLFAVERRASRDRSARA